MATRTPDKSFSFDEFIIFFLVFGEAAPELPGSFPYPNVSIFEGGERSDAGGHTPCLKRGMDLTENRPPRHALLF